MKLCEYGCGQKAKYQLKNGKWCCSKSWNSCPINRKKNSEKLKGRMKGFTPWNKGLKTGPLTKEHKNKISKAKQGVKTGSQSSEHIKKRSELLKRKIPWNKGNSHSEKTKDKMSKSHKNCIPWNKGIPCRRETRQKISKSNKGKPSWKKGIKTKIAYNKNTLEDYKIKYPLFFKIEEIRYNPDKPGKKEIQVHCKNHNCPNSKEKDGWFTPSKGKIIDRIMAIEKPRGYGESHFYCSQYCKNTCPLYGLKNDPLKETKKSIVPYTFAEYSLWRKIVLKRDHNICQICDKPATDAHHILSIKTHPHMALDLDNGISFCKKCHYKYGHKSGTECSTGALAHISCTPKFKKKS